MRREKRERQGTKEGAWSGQEGPLQREGRESKSHEAERYAWKVAMRVSVCARVYMYVRVNGVCMCVHVRARELARTGANTVQAGRETHRH
jgi:hypothetical protein